MSFKPSYLHLMGSFVALLASAPGLANTYECHLRFSQFVGEVDANATARVRIEQPNTGADKGGSLGSPLSVKLAKQDFLLINTSDSDLENDFSAELILENGQTRSEFSIELSHATLNTNIPLRAIVPAHPKSEYQYRLPASGTVSDENFIYTHPDTIEMESAIDLPERLFDPKRHPVELFSSCVKIK